MDEELSVPVTLPLDSDGFLRRECPTCERQFKGYAQDEGAADAEPVDQYFCPYCGVPADTDAWWTQEQLEYAAAAAAPEIERFLEDSIDEIFKGAQGLSYKSTRGSALDVGSPGPLMEPDDMVIVEPPCHPNEPLKIPAEAIARLHCLVCGAVFSA